MIPPRLLRCAVWLGLLLSASAAQPTPAREPTAVDFARDIRPIFNKNCVACHGGVKRAAKISFIYRDVVVATNDDDEKPIHPGDPEHSELIRRVTNENEEDRMPPADHAARLSDHDIALLREWIRQGAKWKEHWAWIKPVAPPQPKVSKPKWLRQPLDAFVLSKLDAEKLKPSPEADRAQWLRRVSFDLTGLPPTLEEIKTFTADKSSRAFETVVDRLLAAPSFGERWATPWLDAARHADSMGYEKDPLRTVWPYRDWVIRALNDDLPFDQFTLKQLAGDLLPDATMADQIATTFHRNTQVNTEGGTDDEEFRIVAVIDRVSTTWEVWQGTTMRCVQCHAHPYEPIKHDEFYRSFALFNTTRDWDLADDTPVLRVPTNADSFNAAQRLDAEISAQRLAEFALAGKLAARDLKWQTLAPSQAAATKGMKLAVETNSEVRTVGTVAHHAQFTIEAPLPDGLTNLGALRIEVLPDNPDIARLTPEPGFVISQLRVSITTNHQRELPLPFGRGEGRGEGPGQPVVSKISDGSTPAAPHPQSLSPSDGEREGRNSDTSGKEKSGAVQANIKLAHCFGDEPEPFMDDDAAVRGDNSGWGANPRLTQPRRAVFVPTQTTPLPAGATLRIVIAHDYGPNDTAALVTRRLRLSVTAAGDWIEFGNTPEFKTRRKEIARLQKQRDAIPNVNLPVMREQPDSFRRTTAEFMRGNWLAKGDPVQPGVPGVFNPLHQPDPSNRLALAHWLVSPENPLTARVTVNRLWAEIFGVGLVETVEDFGSSGQPPANQALLDHLALRFQNDLGWSVKKLLREIVLSATYRQDASVVGRQDLPLPVGRGEGRGEGQEPPTMPQSSSLTTGKDYQRRTPTAAVRFPRESPHPQSLSPSDGEREASPTRLTLIERDPRNRLLARGPRGRLAAEMVRDQALAVSGLLSEKMFGPPVMPLQPDGIWDVIYSDAKWKTSSGEDQHRRALYTFIRRTTGFPSALTFDSPSREVCQTRRIKTNTPLQALVTLNDPVYVECAVALAVRMRREAGDDVRKQIAHGYELATGRPPAKGELQPLAELHRTALARYTAHPDLAKQLAGSPAEAALALVANALLNLDASLTK